MRHYLWRAVDQNGVVLDILVQERRDGAAAKRFFKRLLQGLRYKPKRLITDGLRSYGVGFCQRSRQYVLHTKIPCAMRLPDARVA